MAHDIQEIDGKASFAFNANYGDPWHRLGTPVDGNMTIEEALQAANADFTVTKEPIYVHGVAGVPIEIKDKVATVATYDLGDGNHRQASLGVVGKTYAVVQNTHALEVAYDIVGASKGEAYLDTMGVLGEGAQLFSYLRLEDLIVDPVGINDKVERGLVIWWSHDGSVAMTYLFSATRVVCRNTLNFALSGARNVFRAKHTASVDARLKQAQSVLGVSTAWADAFSQQAEELLKVPYSEDRFQKVLKSVFPEPNNATDRQKENTQATHAQVRGLFANELNSQSFGTNGWTMYNSIVEYLDHQRNGSEKDRLNATMTPGSWVQKKKEAAAKAVLALA
ncbi:MAG: DUF932 domain-containing protein [bacterium]